MEAGRPSGFDTSLERGPSAHHVLDESLKFSSTLLICLEILQITNPVIDYKLLRRLYPDLVQHTKLQEIFSLRVRSLIRPQTTEISHNKSLPVVISEVGSDEMQNGAKPPDIPYAEGLLRRSWEDEKTDLWNTWETMLARIFLLQQAPEDAVNQDDTSNSIDRDTMTAFLGHWIRWHWYSYSRFRHS